jgi:hypothetical protein
MTISIIQIHLTKIQIWLNSLKFINLFFVDRRTVYINDFLEGIY